MLPKWVKKTKLYESALPLWDAYMTERKYRLTDGKKLSELKGCHKGQRCFIIGNGPSLKAEDLDKLQNEICFASNMIYKIYDQTSWRPTYYCNSDTRILKKMIFDPLFWNSGAKIHFFRDESRWQFTPSPPSSSVFFRLKEPSDIRTPAKFSTAMNKQIYDTYTVTYIMIQIACFMGFTDIILLGIDHNYTYTVDLNGNYHTRKTQDHFYSPKNTDDPMAAQVERMELGYASAKKYAQANGIHIYNATRGGKLEIYDRVDLDFLLTKGEKQ